MGLLTSVLTSSSTRGWVTVGAQCGGCSDETRVCFAGIPSAVSISTSLDGMPNDGTSICYVTGTVTDADGNPVPDDTEVTLGASSGELLGYYDTFAGFFQAVLKASDTLGTATISALCGTAYNTTGIDFAGAPNQMTVAITPSILPANSGSTACVEIEVKDSGNRPVPDGTVVTLVATNGTSPRICDNAPG